MSSHGRLKTIWHHSYRRLLVGISAMAIYGCSTMPHENFTFQADMPENFEIDGTANYIAAPDQTCNFSSDKQRKEAERIFFRPLQPKAAHLVEFIVPLTTRVHGCSMILSSLGLGFEGQWGPRDIDMGMEYGGISIRDEPSKHTASFPASGPLVFQGQCQWLFRTYGRYRYIVKIPKCRAVADDGNWEKRLIGEAVQRDQLSGKTVKLILKVAKEELPAVGDNWVRFPTGWKRCMGKGLDDRYAFCSGNTTDFKPFKMPDGRDCTVYPNCTE